MKISVIGTGYVGLVSVIVTEWKEFRSPDFDEIKKRLKRPVIFDGRNLYEPALVRIFGLKYHGVGRGDGVARRAQVQSPHHEDRPGQQQEQRATSAAGTRPR